MKIYVFNLIITNNTNFILKHMHNSFQMINKIVYTSIKVITSSNKSFKLFYRFTHYKYLRLVLNKCTQSKFEAHTFYKQNIFISKYR